MTEQEENDGYEVLKPSISSMFIESLITAKRHPMFGPKKDVQGLYPENASEEYIDSQRGTF